MGKIEEHKNCLHNFKNWNEIRYRYPKIVNWEISCENNEYDKRIEKSMNSNLFKALKEHNTSIINAKNEEILSWIDSMNLVYRIFLNEKLNQEIKRDARIIQEYSIPFTKNNRTDFLVIKDNKILILEFTFKLSKYMDKAQQCFTYKQILQQFVPSNIEIISYVFSYTNEGKDNQNDLLEQIEQCCDFINNFFNPIQAYESLEKIITLKDS